MAVSLTWIRDHYDTIVKDRYIDDAEVKNANWDYFDNLITKEQLQAVVNAHSLHTLLPAYGTISPSTDDVISFYIPTGAILKVDGVEVI
jgi:hypothetical protein